MCKTGTTPKRPIAFQASAGAAPNYEQFSRSTSLSQQQQQSAFPPSSHSYQQPTTPQPPPSFFPTSQGFYNPAYLHMPMNPEPNFFVPQLSNPSSLPFGQALQANPSAWQQALQQQALLSTLAQQTSPVQGCIDLLTKPSLSASALVFDNSRLIELRKPQVATEQMQRSSTSSSIPQSLLIQNSLSIVPPGAETIRKAATKRPISVPESIPDSNSEVSSSESDKNSEHVTKKPRASKKKHEATLDGERRVAIEFESLGSLGALPQTYGKGALIVPDGLSGKYSAFGQRWRFSITHAVGPVICEDGVQRMCLAWSVTNLNSGHTHTVVETPADAMKRDKDGKTLCNRVFRDALSLRASALEAELRNTNDSSVCVDLQSQLRTIQTKRFSEGPLFFGLRHCSLQNEMRKELEKRNASMQLNAEKPSKTET